MDAEASKVLEAVHVLLGRGLLRRSERTARLVLRHDFDRTALKRGLRPDARARKAGRAADALRALPEEERADFVTELARLSVEAGDVERSAAAALDAVTVWREAGDYRSALALLREAMRFTRTGDPLRTNLTEQLFDLELLAGEFDEARKRAKELAALDQTSEGLALRAVRLTSLAASQGRWPEVNSLVADGLKRLGQAKPELQAGLLERRAFAELRRGRDSEANQALELAEQAVGRAGTKAGAEATTAIALVRAGLLQRAGDLSSAMQMLRGAADTAARHGDHVREIHARGNLAIVLRASGDLNAARDVAMATIDLAERVGHVVSHAIAMNTLGNTATNAGGLQEGREWLERALGVFSRIGHGPGRAMALANLGRNFRRMGLYEDSAAHFRTAMEAEGDVGNANAESINALNVIDVAIRMGDQKAASELFRRFQRGWSRRVELPLPRAMRRERQAQRAAARRRVADAERAYHEAADLYGHAGEPQHAQDARAELALFLARVGRRSEVEALQAGLVPGDAWESRVMLALARAFLAITDERWDAAAEELEVARAAVPAEARTDLVAECHYWAGRLAEQRGMLEAAQEELQAARDIHIEIARHLRDEFEAPFLADWRRAEIAERLEGVRAGLRESVGRAPGDVTAEEFARIADLTLELGQVRELTPLLEHILDAAIRFTGAERGFVVLREDDALAFRAARNLDGDKVRQPEIKISTSIAHQAMADGVTVQSANAERDSRFANYISVHRLKLRSVLCAPLRLPDRVLGCIYLEHRFTEDVFGTHARALIESFAGQAAVAIENAGLFEAHAQAVRACAEMQEELRGDLALCNGELRAAAAGGSALTAPEFEGVVGVSPAIQEVRQAISRFAATEFPVLILGESGTGKGVVASAIHRRSARRDGPMVAENLAAIHGPLAASELFGHLRGAFTGAEADRQGLFELAAGGTLFMDEIGDLDPRVQVMLLKVIEERVIRPLGGGESRAVDVRLICATNRDLVAEVRAGAFREDLFFRLNVLTIHIPPLRERIEDLPPLVEHLLARLAQDHGIEPGITKPALTALTKHSWPGNVRELDNELRRAAVDAGDGPIRPAHLSDAVGRRASSSASVLDAARSRGYWTVVHEFEAELIKDAMDANQGNRTVTSRDIQLDRATLLRKVREFGLTDQVQPPRPGRRKK